MRSLVTTLEGEVDRFAGALDPDVLSTADAASLLVEVERVSRKLDAVKLRLARRAEESTRWAAEGHRSPEAWLAQVTGTGFGPATRMFATARQLDALPDTARALSAGELSQEQAAEIAAAATVDPTAEAALLDVAQRDTLAGLRREAERVKAAATDEVARYERIRKNRHFRQATGADGSCRLFGSNTADVNGAIWAALRTEADRLFDEARRNGRRESPDAYVADALYNLVVGHTSSPGATDTRNNGAGASDADGSDDARGGPGARSKVPPRIDRVVHVRADGPALDRGYTKPGEICEVVGSGPVPAALVRAWCTDALVRILEVDGVDVTRVVHRKRGVTEAQRTALYERARFMCEITGCGVTHGLEIDHITGWALTGTTVLDDLALLCKHDHFLKTCRGFTLEGTPGNRRLVPPPTPPPEPESAPEPARPAGITGIERARAALDRARNAITGPHPAPT